CSSSQQVSALMAIKGSLVDPMNNLKNWNRGDPCTKNWTGVFCHDLGDTYLHVTELQLFRRNLSGNLVPEGFYVEQFNRQHPKRDRQYHYAQTYIIKWKSALWSFTR
ncbi:Os05g0481100, partial [Oryza sativa Japonica Group]